MKILMLSFYYPPDIGPGPLRAHSIVEAIKNNPGNEVYIDILTTMPNRYSTLPAEALAREQGSVVSIHRIELPIHKSGMGDQAVAFISYARTVIKEIRGQEWDLVVATSSRLMTAALGAYIAVSRGSLLYLDIRDLFSDTMDSILRKRSLRILLPLIRVLEQWTFKSADRINVVSEGFLPYVKEIVPTLSPSVFTNGIDDEFLAYDFIKSDSDDLPTVVYAGNIGEGQGLDLIIPDVARANLGRALFRVIGDGGKRKELLKRLDEQGLSNVQVQDPVPRAELLAYYRDADILFLHLNAYSAFEKVLPSKIFEYGATGKPILAGVSGYAGDYLRANVPGVEVFEPCDHVGMQLGLQRLLAGPRMIDRRDFKVNNNRMMIAAKMANDILSLVEKAD